MRQRTQRKVAMTDRWLRDLEGPPAPPESNKTATVMWWDSESPLIVRTSSRGGKSLMTWYHNKAGTLRWYTIGRCPPWTRINEARDVAFEVRKRAAEGDDPHADKIEARRRHRELLSFGQLATRYLAAAENRSKAVQYRPRLEVDVLPEWRGRKAVDVTADDARALINRIAERSPSMARLVQSAASSVFTWAIGSGVIRMPVNPFTRLDVPAARKTEEDDRTRVFSHDELRKMWAVFGDDDCGRALKVMTLTGQRVNEVARMKWQEVSGRQWSLPRGRVKTKAAHEIWLSKAALELIGEPGEGLVFPNAAKKHLLAKRWALVEDKTGIEQADEEGAQIRDLRRTLQTNVSEYIDEPWLADMMTNQMKKGMARIYDKAKHRRRMADAWDAWAKMLTDRIITGKPVRDDNVRRFPGTREKTKKIV